MELEHYLLQAHNELGQHETALDDLHNAISEDGMTREEARLLIRIVQAFIMTQQNTTLMQSVFLTRKRQLKTTVKRLIKAVGKSR